MSRAIVVAATFRGAPGGVSEDENPRRSLSRLTVESFGDEVAIAVLDDGGCLKVLKREDAASILRPFASAGTGTIVAGDIITFAGDTNKYVVTTGNSFAAPHITGITALIRAKHPELTPFQVKSVLLACAANTKRK